MRNIRKTVQKRVLAIIMAILLAVSAIPLPTFVVHAGTGANPDVFTFTVKDTDGNPVEAALVTVENADAGLTWEVTTDALGEAAFDEFTAKKDDDTIAELTCTYTVSKQGYKTQTGDISANDAQPATWTADKEIILIEALADIELEISGYAGAYDGSEHDAVILPENISDYTFEYSIDTSTAEPENKTYGTTMPTVLNVSDNKTIWVKVSCAGYQTRFYEVSVQIQPVNRTDFEFREQTPPNIDWESSATFYAGNTASSQQEPETVTYTSSDEDIATVDSDGKVTFKTAGTVTIMADMPESASGNYSKSRTEYTITALSPRPAFGFTSSAVTFSYDHFAGENANTYTNPLKMYEGSDEDAEKGDIIYEIISQKRDDDGDGIEEEVSNAAQINAHTGELTILSAGTIQIKATVSSTDHYSKAEAEYTLTVNKAVQTGFVFTIVKDTLVYDETFTYTADGGESTGSIRYNITQGEDLVTAVHVDGGIQITADNSVRTVEITAVKAGDTRYQEKTAVYHIALAKSKQPEFQITNTQTRIDYGTQELQIETQGGQTQEAVQLSYEIIQGNDIAAVNSQGQITFQSGKLGSVTMRVTKPGGAYYEDTDAVWSFEVVYADVEGDIRVQGKQGNNGWYTGAVSVKAPSDGYSVRWDNDFTAAWADTLTVADEGAYAKRWVYVKDNVTGAIAQKTLDEIKIDLTGPAENSLSITYSKAFKDIVLEGISFGFYKAPITVKLRAEDNLSGISAFIYDIGNGEVTINAESNAFTVDKTNKACAEATFTIAPQYKGKVSFKAVNGAGLESECKEDTKVLAADDQVPIIKVSDAGSKPVNKKYYVGDRVVKYYAGDRIVDITLTEDNFYPVNSEEFYNDIIITVSKRHPGEAEAVETVEKPVFKKNGNQYTAQLIFSEEAAYTLQIECTDILEKTAAYSEDFVIDKTQPVIEVGYKNNEVLNDRYFKAGRTATVKITEQNLNTADVNVHITKDGEEYNQAVKWTKQGEDVYTADIPFEQEGTYQFNIDCKDLTLRSNSEVVYAAGTKAAKEFVIDKTKPAASVRVANAAVDKTWDSLLSSFSFGIYTNETVHVFINGSDNLSGIQEIKHFRSSQVLTISELKQSGLWTDAAGQSAEYAVEPDEQFIVYVYLKDKAGNEQYISSDGIIVDQTQPFFETIAPQVTVTPTVQPVNGIYNTDVYMDVQVYDPVVNGTYSGLRSVTWEVLNMGQQTQQGNLYWSEEADTVQPLQAFAQDGCICVDRNKNNSNDVTVKVTAADYAGNIMVSTCTLQIDITPPAIEVTYDNNNEDTTFTGFFRENRTAKIQIAERNFDPDNTQLLIINAEGGEVPQPTEWERTDGDGNGDNTVYTAYLTYEADGSYVFDIASLDLAGNGNSENELPVVYGDSVSPTGFIIDKTIPIIHVAYDNNNAVNGNYYNQSRTATITIEEHNFDESRVTVDVTASDHGADAVAPALVGWESSGDLHTAAIVYAQDALYSFTIQYADMAGNEAEVFERQEFYVDQTLPEITITGVENQTAYNDTVIPVITCSDTNFDAGNVRMTLTGANRGVVTVTGSLTENGNGQTFTFGDFVREKEIDDIYTLEVELTDQAGNISTQTLVFSVNRFGSTYETLTQGMNGLFVKEAQDLVVSEVNADALRNIKVTLFKNDKTITLNEGTDYSVEMAGGNGNWYQYTYTIFKKNFTDDGVYRLTIHSEDAAGNIAENTLDTKDKEITFGVDKTAPNVIVANLESKATYAVEKLTVVLAPSDNLKLASIVVYLDGAEYKRWALEDIEQMVSSKSDFTFDISDDTTAAHQLRIVCTDAAGNESVTELTDFYVTTNLWVRYYNNKALFFGSIGGGLAVLAGCAGAVVLILRRKRR